MTLDALARKYRVLVALREAHARGEGIAPAATLRALAAEFPGALRELDRTPMDVLHARRDAVARACVDRAAHAPWMEWMLAWHGLTAAALTQRRDPAAALPDDVMGVRLDDAWREAVRAPPRGRLCALVDGRVAARFGVDVDTLRATLFPRG